MSTALFSLLLLCLLMEAIKSQLSDEDSSEFTIATEAEPTTTEASESLDSESSHPNIVFILADDWGINDVGWTHDNTDTLTPYLDNLAKTEGLILTNYYAERVCTASRAAFLTGRYPSHLGLQSGVCASNQPAALTRQVSMLSNEFQSSGYTTHLIGKWHLGMMAYEYTPTYRGFDTFYGYWAGGEDYYTHRSWSFLRQITSGDLYINDKPALYQWGGAYSRPYDGIYGVWWQQAETLKLLQSKVNTDAAESAPFFLYLAMQASHSPREAPAEYMALYEDGAFAENHNRISFMAQTTTGDDAIRAIVEYLKESGLWLNTLVVITSDNGAKRQFGDNAPYRGFKNTSWEGGVKVPGFITGGYLSETMRGKQLKYGMHIVDWYPTLLAAAGKHIKYERSRKLYEIEENFDEFLMLFKEDTKWDHVEELALDGINMWPYIENEKVDDEYFSTQREILLDLKDVWCRFTSCGALRVGQYKYIRGENIASLLPDYDDGDKWFRGYAKDEAVAEAFCNAQSAEFMAVHRVDSFEINSVDCVDTEEGCLFDLELDPCEYYNLAAIYLEITAKLQLRLDEFQQRATEPLIGEKNADELFGREMIEPLRVCHNPSFWCPFKQYKEVQFEYKLYESYKKFDSVEAENMGADDGEATIIVENGWDLKHCILYIGVPAFVVAIVICVVLFCCWFNSKRKKEKERITNDEIVDDISEVQPLIIWNDSKKKQIEYGSTI